MSVNVQIDQMKQNNDINFFKYKNVIRKNNWIKRHEIQRGQNQGSK
ncbi:MAG: hypothetical protein Fur0010_10900 [Bdellovibrio sp.]